MKKLILLKIRLLTMREYKRLARILRIRLGHGLEDSDSIFKALEYDCKKIDPKFDYSLVDMPSLYQGGYDRENHKIFIDGEVYDRARNGSLGDLYTIVHEISHWALLTVFHIEPKCVILELPLIHNATTDAELYADMFSCYMMLPMSVFCGSKKAFKKFRIGKNKGIYQMSSVILKNRRHYRAIGFHKAKKIA